MDRSDDDDVFDEELYIFWPGVIKLIWDNGILV